ncbi:DUF4373 domain-containing protein [Paenibacillus polymyxa]|uniref:DUF4373 domain-containing protein n=1 Tax=Paenibacillus TaxID=44249 RepID=UPI0020240136|nr:DUF4373 domain-containing protein [Paenibacillus polymyxa]URJ42181.1 DUF4373 domain-containing protein [Paenibacillus polymyxa]
MKEAYYFSHDSNARHDPKITAMRGVYGSEGYGWYWILVEMMRESDGYKLDMRSKYAYYAFASQMQCDSDTAHKFIQDCITEFDLFAADETHFWSASLLRRMEKKEEKSEKARKAAEARWGKKTASDKGSSEDVGNDECDLDANAYADESKNDALKESKGKESKRNKNDLKDMFSNEFETFWNEYPRKIGKKECYKKWLQVIKKESPELIIQCAINYRLQCDRLKTETQFIKHPKSFLNEDRYKDYLEGGLAVGHQQSQPFNGGQAASSKRDANGQAQASQDSWSFTDRRSNQQDRQEGERRGLPGDSHGSTGTGSKYDMFVRR